MIYTLLYYIFFSSAVLIYGVGLNDATIVCTSISELRLNFTKVVASIIGTVCLSWTIIKYFLLPLNLAELYPFVAVLIFLAISVFFETMIRITTKRTTADFNFSMLIIILTLNESVHIIDVLLISAASLVSFFIVLPFLYVIMSKFHLTEQNDCRRMLCKPIFLISFAVLIMAIYVVNVSFFYPGSLK
ncbi:MAG: hypothetical protein K2M50_05785 [Treponemataceae bacterium]|nr:hypothetical protein [Treponema sp.]MDE6245152.1 hypothetical protein [Treponemataceae bacterium]